MAKAYFTPEVFQFLAQLKRNNKREWFLKNRERYEEVARQPCLRFITDFQFRLREISPWIKSDPKPNGGSLMRIYRDIRFSPNKSPYKTNLGMHFPHAGSKENIHGASFYLHIAPGECFLAGGCWHPDPRSLAKIRDAIAWKSDEWKKATRRIELGGDTLSRPPRGYRADHPMIQDLKRKDFIASIEFTDKQVCGEKFMNEVVAGCRQLRPLVGFLCGAVGLAF
jgi:uncharacterized protein (TIGR02453 family)